MKFNGNKMKKNTDMIDYTRILLNGYDLSDPEFQKRVIEDHYQVLKRVFNRNEDKFHDFLSQILENHLIEKYPAYLQKYRMSKKFDEESAIKETESSDDISAYSSKADLISFTANYFTGNRKIINFFNGLEEEDIKALTCKDEKAAPLQELLENRKISLPGGIQADELSCILSEFSKRNLTFPEYLLQRARYSLRARDKDLQVTVQYRKLSTVIGYGSDEDRNTPGSVYNFITKHFNENGITLNTRQQEKIIQFSYHYKGYRDISLEKTVFNRASNFLDPAECINLYLQFKQKLTCVASDMLKGSKTYAAKNGKRLWPLLIDEFYIKNKSYTAISMYTKEKEYDLRNHNQNLAKELIRNFRKSFEVHFSDNEDILNNESVRNFSSYSEKISGIRRTKILKNLLHTCYGNSNDEDMP